MTVAAEVTPNENKKFEYEFPRASITVDIVVFKYDENMREHVLLIRRGCEPYKGKYALPGGFMNMDETLQQTAARELLEETGIEINKQDLKMFHTYDAPGRDPRGRVITVAFVGILRSTKIPIAGDDAASAMWIPADEIPLLAFDHTTIVAHAKKEILRGVFNREQ